VGRLRAAKRRTFVRREEERMEEERRAYLQAYVRNWGETRGQFAFLVCLGWELEQNIIQRIHLEITSQL
jgi:hypothetical protein